MLGGVSGMFDLDGLGASLPRGAQRAMGELARRPLLGPAHRPFPWGFWRAVRWTFEMLSASGCIRENL